MNKVILIGNVGKEPELKQVSDVNYCTFSLATNEGYKDKNGEWQNKAEWHNIVAWRNTAEYAAKNLKKGMQVVIEGKLRTRSWQDKQTDKTMYATEIIVDNMRILEKKDKANSNTPPPMEEDDLPFD